MQAGRILNLPVVADLHGIWSEELVATGSTRRGGRADRNLRALDSAIAASADHVTVVSSQMQEYLVSKMSADPARISVVLNGALPHVTSVPVHPNPRRLVFAGNLSPIQNIKLLLEAVSIVHEKSPRIEFYLTARGELTKSVRNQCERMGLPARFFWFEDSEKFFQFLATCDVGLLPANNDPGRQMAYPAKLYSYMAVGLPIVTNRIGSWSDIVEEEQIGIVTDNTSAAFASGILELLENPDRSQRYGERALALLRTKYAYAKEVEKFASIYSNLCGPRVRSAPMSGLESM
jgi:glycosyltransferase involved in cell wall biosynthesis